MLVKELAVINKLDQEIAGMHEQLHALYQKRQQLLGDRPLQTVVSPTDLETVQLAWGRLGVTLPTDAAFQKRFQKAKTLVKKLAKLQPSLEGQLAIVAVPPTPTLFAALEVASAQGSTRHADILSSLAESAFNSWECIIVFDWVQRQPVVGLQAYLSNQSYLIDSYDTRGMGLRELVAADLQGVQVVAAGSWSLLLKEASDSFTAPCVTSVEGRLVVDVEDTGCLLGDNYVVSTIKAG